MADGSSGSNLQIGLGVAGALGLGGIITKIIESYFGKRKTSAETDEAVARTDRTEAETAKLRAETDDLIRAVVARQVQFILDDHQKQREMDRQTIAAMEQRIQHLERELRDVGAELRNERALRSSVCGGCDKWPLFGAPAE
jgi:vacuolar-type H+-ATPase subunit I/STV1